MHLDFTDSTRDEGRIANFFRGFGGTFGLALATLWFFEKAEFSKLGALHFVCGVVFAMCTLTVAAYAYDSLLKAITQGKSLENHFINYFGRRLLLVSVFVIATFAIVCTRYHGS